jgi:hypothetical protein
MDAVVGRKKSVLERNRMLITEFVGLRIKFQAHIREVLSSRLGLDT